MHLRGAWLRGVLVHAVCTLASLTASAARSETAVPPQLRELVEQQIVVGVDTTTQQPRLLAGARFKKVPHALRARAIAIACAHARKLRPSAAELVVIDDTGTTIETAAIRPQQ